MSFLEVFSSRSKVEHLRLGQVATVFYSLKSTFILCYSFWFLYAFFISIAICNYWSLEKKSNEIFSCQIKCFFLNFTCGKISKEPCATFLGLLTEIVKLKIKWKSTMSVFIYRKDPFPLKLNNSETLFLVLLNIFCWNELSLTSDMSFLMEMRLELKPKSWYVEYKSKLFIFLVDNVQLM